MKTTKCDYVDVPFIDSEENDVEETSQHLQEIPEATNIQVQSPPDATPLSIVERAIDSGYKSDELHKLLDFQERVEAKNAKREYEKAMVLFSSICPPIEKTGDAKGRYKFPKFPVIMDTIRPYLHQAGLSVRFKRAEPTLPDHVATVCIVSHASGHSEEHPWEAPIDKAESKAGNSLMNSTQQVGSANSYVKRYAVADALALSFYDGEDDDASSLSCVEYLNEETARGFRTRLEKLEADEKFFCQWVCKVSFLEEVPVKHMTKIENAISEKENQS